ncbi:MAG: hypothetical protein ABIO81_06855 [Ginsengibacter sp.]
MWPKIVGKGQNSEPPLSLMPNMTTGAVNGIMLQDSTYKNILDVSQVRELHGWIETN